MSDEMLIDITNVDGSALTGLFLVSGVAQTIRVKNLEAVAKDCILFGTCDDDKPASMTGLTNYEGKELIDELWAGARKLGDTLWTQIGEPTYADAFADVADNLLSFTLTASGYQDVEIIVNTPVGAASSWVVNFQIGVKAVPSA